jgi:hypothetical protein
VPLALRLFVAPWPLSVDYDRHLLGAPVRADVVLTLLLAAAGAFALARAPRLRARVGRPLLFAFLFFLPTSGLLIALKSPTADRFLLLPCSVAVAAVAAPPTSRRGPRCAADWWRRSSRARCSSRRSRRCDARLRSDAALCRRSSRAIRRRCRHGSGC